MCTSKVLSTYNIDKMQTKMDIIEEIKKERQKKKNPNFFR